MTKDLKICGEIILPIHHCLLSKNKSTDKIKTLYAHGQSLAQCHDWIMINLPNVNKVPVMSNAEGARLSSKDQGSHQLLAIRQQTYIA